MLEFECQMDVFWAIGLWSPYQGHPHWKLLKARCQMQPLTICELVGLKSKSSLVCHGLYAYVFGLCAPRQHLEAGSSKERNIYIRRLPLTPPQKQASWCDDGVKFRRAQKGFNSHCAFPEPTAPK